MMEEKVDTIKGVGAKTAAALNKYGFNTVKDLYYYFPRAYEDYHTLSKISDLKPGKVIVKAKIRNLRNIYTRRRNFTITNGEIYDDSGSVKVVWYNQPYRTKNFDTNKEYYFTGLFDLKFNQYQLVTPTATLASEVEETKSSFQPIYPAKGSYKPIWFRRFFDKIRGDFADVPDLLPGVKTGSRASALYNIHFPDNQQDVINAKKYLGYEELFELILAAKLNKIENQKLHSNKLPFVSKNTKEFISSLPFNLTNAQRRATWDILQDLEKDIPMNRLLQGDVGSGKTVVAAISAYQAYKAGFQTTLLAPTAILATQHYEKFKELLSPLGVKVELLIGASKKKDEIKNRIKSGKADIIIGTHAILTDDTIFHSLALCIIDEQHRFGVLQRQKLLEKTQKNTTSSQILAPHFLAMTATPIPRSLQLTIFGDLDVSVINELPKGRQKIETKILSEIHMEESLYPILKEKLKKKEQIYWICKLVEESDITEATDVKRESEKLKKIFSGYKVAYLHGKMKTDEKDRIMQEFKEHKIDILVSTTVVEVGVDVPNATQIIIRDAEGFGLAQLHQLRGRVGRGNKPSSCYLITKGEEKPSTRLKELEKSTDGFYLAEVDLKIRGPGQIYGTMQHGELNLKIASLTDSVLISRAQKDVSCFVQDSENMLKYKELMDDVRKYQQLTTLN